MTTHIATSNRPFHMMAGGTGLAAVPIWQGPFVLVQCTAVKNDAFTHNI
jgi:hypothetical protein